MRYFRWGLIDVAAAITFLLLSGAVEARAQGTFTRILDIPYVSNGSPAQKLDLYIPDGATSRTPLIIWIHGGGWQSGDKSLGQNSFQLRYPRNGYALASINYRLSGEAIFPAQIHDCKAAIRWLRANAGQYNIDPARIGVWGSSAGGHLAALVATSNDVADLEGNLGGNVGETSRVQAAIDWYGPTDFLQMDAQTRNQPGCGNGNHDAPDSAESRLLGCPIQSCPAAAARANPMTYVSVDDPPFFIQHGTADCTVPTMQSTIFSELLTDAGHDSLYIPIQTAGHGGPLFSAESNLQLSDQFWESKLRQAVSPILSSVKLFRKGQEVAGFRPGSLGALYRIKLSGLNLSDRSRILINGTPKSGALSENGDLEVYGLNGRMPAFGEIKIQIRHENGSYSNEKRIPIIAG